MKFQTLLTTSLLLLLSCSQQPDRAENDNVMMKDSISGATKPSLISDTSGLTYPTQAKIKHGQIETGDNDTLFATLNNFDYTVYPNGKIKKFKNGTLITSYQLTTDERVENAYLFYYKNNLIVYYTETDSETGGSIIESLDTLSAKRNWNTRAFGFNLGQPVVKVNNTYVSTIGFVGKLNLQNGKYYWKHEDLYDRQTYSFNQFDSVLFVGDKVFFTSNNSNKHITDTVIVNDITGKADIRK
ncbi:MAG: hypothetical protein V4619_11095 [Bacteroidota bacterium]